MTQWSPGSDPFRGDRQQRASYCLGAGELVLGQLGRTEAKAMKGRDGVPPCTLACLLSVLKGGKVWPERLT